MWLNRRGRKYFYKSIRVDGQSRKVYVGAGPAAEAAAAEVEQRRLERKAVSETRATRRAEVGAAEGPLDALCDSLDELVAAVLLALGYHRHDRGPWRKRRDPRQPGADPTGATASDPTRVARGDRGGELG
jgi:hypothetical protein